MTIHIYNNTSSNDTNVSVICDQNNITIEMGNLQMKHRFLIRMSILLNLI